MKNIDFRNLEKEIINKITDDIEEEFYKEKRYKIESSLAIMCSEKEIQELLVSKFRKTDKVIKIEDFVYVVIFKYTEVDKAFKALQNFYLTLCPYMSSCKLDTGLISLKEGEQNLKKLVSRGLIELKKALDTYENAIEVYDENKEFILK